MPITPGPLTREEVDEIIARFPYDKGNNYCECVGTFVCGDCELRLAMHFLNNALNTANARIAELEDALRQQNDNDDYDMWGGFA